MSIGDSETFTNANWSKLPFFIEASVEGRIPRKSQLLSVPIAEYAERTGTLTDDLLCSKEWINRDKYSTSILIFNHNNSFQSIYKEGEHQSSKLGTYCIDGNIISMVYDSDQGKFFHFNELHKCLINDGGIWK